MKGEYRTRDGHPRCQAITAAGCQCYRRGGLTISMYRICWHHRHRLTKQKKETSFVTI
jgi:hypothetical protein